MAFEANRGQTDPEVLFVSRSRDYALFLTRTEAVLALKSPAPAQGPGASPMFFEEGPLLRTAAAREVALRLTLAGANPRPTVAPLDELPGRANYLIGNDPRAWQTGVPTYGRVRYDEVYPGIDLVFHGTQGRLEYDFIVEPGGRPELIRLAFHGARGMSVRSDGSLLVHTEAGDVVQHAPVVSEMLAGEWRPVAGRYVITALNEVGFDIGPRHPAAPLVIDPVLSYSTYLGGADFDIGRSVAVDASGNAYVVGETFSTDFPTMSPLQAASAGSADLFVAKLDSSGSNLVYSTYLGGTDFERGFAVAVDASGNAYLTGETFSTDFPTASPLQPANAGGGDAFVAKLDPSGSNLVYATYLGGESDDAARAIAVDASGNTYVTGKTFSTGFPTAAPIQPANAGLLDAFVAKLDASGSVLVYSTFLGGNDFEEGFGIGVDALGNTYVAGATDSANFPTASPLQSTKARNTDAFVAKLDAAGSALVYSTFLGGNWIDGALALAVDGAGNAYVTGQTRSRNFPTATALQPTRGGRDDAFVAKLDPSGSALVYSTYLGGRSLDLGNGIAVDALGNAYVTGETRSHTFPTANALQAVYAFRSDAFVAKLDAAGSALTFSTFLGGRGFDRGSGIAVDGAGNAYVTGRTDSSDFPTASPLQSANAGVLEAFVAKLTP